MKTGGDARGPLSMNGPPPSSGLPARNVRRKSTESLPPVETPAKQKPGQTKRPPSAEPRIVRVLRTLAGLALIIGIASAVVWGARRYVKTSPRFAVNEIVTIGGKRRSPDEVASIAGISKGQNVFSIDLDRARARLVQDPWIAEAHVARQLPGTVYLRVTEREAAGILAMQEGTYLVTREGAIIKRTEPGDPVDVPVVTGLKLQELVDDRDGAMQKIRRALDLAADYDHSPLAHRAPAQEVHIEATGDLTLVVGKKTVLLKMGAPPYRRKIEQAVRVVAELDRRGATPDTIMLDDEARPERVVVRMR
jgi:cell division protein FtsQ